MHNTEENSITALLTALTLLTCGSAVAYFRYEAHRMEGFFCPLAQLVAIYDVSRREYFLRSSTRGRPIRQPA